jgi:hypothetical protein
MGAMGRRSSLAHHIAYAAVVSLACSQSAPAPSGAPDVFVASARSFDGFRTWWSVAITADDAPGDSHLNGPRHVFLNQKPPPGSDQFPVGTIIVKETDPGPIPKRSVFAMVKRGGDYDPTGAPNWEWFELANTAEGTEIIVWRGPGPSGGGAYGEAPLGGCNACHGSAAETDYVLTPQLEEMIEPAHSEAGPAVPSGT